MPLTNHIYLLRHGKPDYPNASLLNGKQFKQWVVDFNNRGIVPNSNPERKIVQIAKYCNVVLSSSMPRAIDSAKRIGNNITHTVDPLFNELDIPTTNGQFFKAPLNAWLISLRTLWFMGFRNNCNSFKKERERSSHCSAKLEELAKRHESVMLIGHEFNNKFIGLSLRKNGWHRAKVNNSRYWSLTEFTKEKQKN